MPAPPFQIGTRGPTRQARRAKTRRRVTRRVARRYAKTHQRMVYRGQDARRAPLTHRLDRAAQRLRQRVATWAKPYPWINTQTQHGLEEGEELWAGFVRFLDSKERGARDSYDDIVRTGREAIKDVRDGLTEAAGRIEKLAWRVYVRLA